MSESVHDICFPDGKTLNVCNGIQSSAQFVDNALSGDSIVRLAEIRTEILRTINSSYLVSLKRTMGLTLGFQTVVKCTET